MSSIPPPRTVGRNASTRRMEQLREVRGNHVAFGDVNGALVGWTVNDGVHSIEINGTLTGSAQDLTAGIWRCYALKDVYGRAWTQSIRSFAGQIDIVDVPASFTAASGGVYIGIMEGTSLTNNAYELIGFKMVGAAAFPRGAVFDGSSATAVAAATGGSALATDGPVSGTFSFSPATTGDGGSSQGYVQRAGIVDADGNARTSGGAAVDILTHVYADPYLVIGVMADNVAIDCTVQVIPAYAAIQGEWTGIW